MVLHRYEENRARIIIDGYNLSDYEKGVYNAATTYNRRWKQGLVFNHLNTDEGAAKYSGEKCHFKIINTIPFTNTKSIA